MKDFYELPEKTQAMWYEWLIAQELQRRAAIHHSSILEPLAFWQNKSHEIDFVTKEGGYIEVKKGKTSPLEFTWFEKQFPNEHLLVANQAILRQHTLLRCF